MEAKGVEAPPRGVPGAARVARGVPPPSAPTAAAGTVARADVYTGAVARCTDVVAAAAACAAACASDRRSGGRGCAVGAPPVVARREAPGRDIPHPSPTDGRGTADRRGRAGRQAGVGRAGRGSHVERVARQGGCRGSQRASVHRGRGATHAATIDGVIGGVSHEGAPPGGEVEVSRVGPRGGVAPGKRGGGCRGRGRGRGGGRGGGVVFLLLDSLRTPTDVGFVFLDQGGEAGHAGRHVGPGSITTLLLLLTPLVAARQRCQGRHARRDVVRVKGGDGGVRVGGVGGRGGGGRVVVSVGHQARIRGGAPGGGGGGGGGPVVRLLCGWWEGWDVSRRGLPFENQWRRTPLPAPLIPPPWPTQPPHTPPTHSLSHTGAGSPAPRRGQTTRGAPSTCARAWRARASRGATAAPRRRVWPEWRGWRSVCERVSVRRGERGRGGAGRGQPFPHARMTFFAGGPPDTRTAALRTTHPAHRHGASSHVRPRRQLQRRGAREACAAPPHFEIHTHLVVRRRAAAGRASVAVHGVVCVRVCLGAGP